MLENRHFWNLILSPSELLIFAVLSAGLLSKPAPQLLPGN